MHNLIMKSAPFRTPFHPVRLINFLDKIFFLEMEDFAQPEDEEEVELVSKELNHLATILHVYARSLIFMKFN